MSIPGAANPLLLASAVSTQYTVSRSLRFNASDSGYCSRTPASAGNRRTFTFASWIKRAGLSSSGYFHIFSAGTVLNETDYFSISFWEDKLDVTTGAADLRKTTAVYRDTSAWYHIVVAVDTTQATAANRVKVYVNGVEVTAFDVNANPTLNADLAISRTLAHDIGRNSYNSSNYFSGYLADVHFIDGQALTPSSFTEVSATTGQLIPKKYTGTFTGNSFWLPFSDNSSTTSGSNVGIGKDFSGLGNYWNTTNLSVTAGAGNDSLVDTPTSYGTDTGAGGEVRGNYATLNPLQISANAALTNGGLNFASSAAADTASSSTIVPQTGKWYWEVSWLSAYSSAYWGSAGVMSIGAIPIAANNSGHTGVWVSTDSGIGGTYSNGVRQTTSTAFASNDIIGLAFDADAMTLDVYVNNSKRGNTLTVPSGQYKPFVSNSYSPANCVVNFGQRPFAYTAPSGFKALVDTNLPTPVVAKPSVAMGVVTDTGANILSAAQALQANDLIWIKDRANNSTDHKIIDTVRGSNAVISSSSTAAETTYSAPSGNSVAWTWEENASYGFDIVSYAGDNTSNRNISHSLGVAVNMAWIRSRSTGGFYIWHSSLASNAHFLRCDSTNGTASSSNTNTPFGTGNWSSTQFMVTNNATNNLNASSTNYIAYLWSQVVGYSSFGSYVGNGSSDGVFVYTGFRPRWILTKRSDSTGDWLLHDTSRSPYNVAQNILFANTSNAENAFGVFNIMDVLSNGFKLRLTGDPNTSNGTFVYAAFAESPFQYARAR